ncbi:MAG: phosphopantothenoylcysteine decarboxylase [Planctomycetota bacterium]
MPNDSPHILITAGPTHEPIDAVRYLANRSSGRLGTALADRSAERGWRTTLLLGPTDRVPEHSQVNLVRFQTTADLERALGEHFEGCDVLVMAAAVADYRPKSDQNQDPSKTKLRREPGEMVLRLESTPDLLTGCAARRQSNQLLVGFALEPIERLESSARSKLERKGLDLIVANALETMDAPDVDARLYGVIEDATGGKVAKEGFADWLLDRIERAREARA